VNDHLASDSDIFLTPLWFSDRGSSFTNDDFIDDHELGPSDLQRVSDFNHEPGYGHRVALAEEALIAYFKPEHNDNLREWGRTLTASAREMRATGLRVLSVTVTNDNGVTLLYSPHAPDARLSHRARFVVGMTEQEMRGIRHVKPDGDSVGDDIDAFINDIEDSRPAGLIAGVALPDEKAIANRQGSGRAKGFKPKKRRILAEQEYEPNKKSPTPMERIMRRRGFELQGRPGIHIKGWPWIIDDRLVGEDEMMAETDRVLKTVDDEGRVLFANDPAIGLDTGMPTALFEPRQAITTISPEPDRAHLRSRSRLP
jgi:hypothetical protein